jgi:DNA replication protein DnaC
VGAREIGLIGGMKEFFFKNPPGFVRGFLKKKISWQHGSSKSGGGAEKEREMKEGLEQTLKKLRLSGLAKTLEVRLQEAAGGRLSHAEFLELILQDELVVRLERLRNRRVKAAAFREVKTLEDFDWAFNSSIKRQQVFELATCRFISERQDVLFLGPPGTGKSHLVQALGYQAIKFGFVVLYRSIFDVVRDFLHDEALGGEEKMLLKYLKPDLLIIDDMGMKQLPKRSGEYLFEIIMRRHETRSTIMTSNRLCGAPHNRFNAELIVMQSGISGKLMIPQLFQGDRIALPF